MRLIVARCEVRYTGRLTAVLPEALRLLMVKSDGSFMVHADTGGFKPSNWMTAPTVIEEEPDRIVVRKRAGATEDQLEILIAEIVSDVTHDMGEAAALEKDGVERDLQEALAAAPENCGEGFRLVRREWPTDIGPVDLMCRDGDDEWIAVEIKRIATIDAVEQLTRYLDAHPPGPRDGELPRRARRAGDQAAGARARAGARAGLRRGRPRDAARRARAGSHAVRGLKPLAHGQPVQVARRSALGPGAQISRDLDNARPRASCSLAWPGAPHRSSRSVGVGSRWTATRCSTSSSSA